jgi:uncharacterized LabA/DUF88 family protein
MFLRAAMLSRLADERDLAMNVAVFVDAGYVYALCCIAQFNAPQPRLRITLDIEAVIRQLKMEVAALDGGGGRLIRIYWYDGAPKSGMTADQARTASLADVKLRLGSVNNYGEQKGVDALIAHDLSELARNRAIDAAILVSGDEDILVGVQTAQTFGVRVHLLGIDPMHSQAQRLRYEADVCHEWPEGLVAPWVAFRPGARAPQAGYAGFDEADGAAAIPEMEPIVDAMYPAVEGREYAILDLWDRANRIAREVDSQLMRVLSSTLGRQLSPQEKPALRQAFIDALRATLEGAAPQTAGADDGMGAPAAAYSDLPYDEAAGFAPEIAPERVAEIAAEMLPAIRDRVPRIVENWERSRRLPVDVNVHLLKTARDIAGAEIENRAALRETFMSALRAAAEQQPANGVTYDAALAGTGEAPFEDDGPTSANVDPTVEPEEATPQEA